MNPAVFLCICSFVATKWVLTCGSGAGIVVPVLRQELKVCSDNDAGCDKEEIAYEAISALHRQIDDDHDGDVDLTESDEFLRDELQYTDGYERHNTFHGKDSKVSVEELWKLWKTSDVHNWTMDDTLDWLVMSVDLPQYVETFQTNVVDGGTLPRIATSPQFISGVLGIKNPVHKQKLALKAMDAVLFGPPKKGHSYLKDLILVTSLIVATGGCWFAYIQHKYSKSHLKKMMKDLDTLQKAEDSLVALQDKLNIAQREQKSVEEEKQTLEKNMRDEIDETKREAQRLKEQRENSDESEKAVKLAEEELEHVRSLLSQAEQQFEEQQWMPPPELQQWLQLTYEIELKHYNIKKTAAERQLFLAKEGCEKIRKKRNTFMGSLRIVHSSSIEIVDQHINDVRSSLEAVRLDLQERLNRWRKIELLCGFPIINNPGLSVLESALRDSAVTAPTQPSNLSSQGSGHSSSVMLSSMEDTDEDIAVQIVPGPTIDSRVPKHHGRFYALGLAAMYATSFRRRQQQRQQQQQQQLRPRSQSLITSTLGNINNPLNHTGPRISCHKVVPPTPSNSGTSSIYHSQPEIPDRRINANLPPRGHSEIWSIGQRNDLTSAQENTAPSDESGVSIASSSDNSRVTFSLDGGPSSPDSLDSMTKPSFPNTLEKATSTQKQLHHSKSLQETSKYVSVTTSTTATPTAVNSRKKMLSTSHSDPYLAFMGAQVSQPTKISVEEKNTKNRLEAVVNGNSSSSELETTSNRRKNVDMLLLGGLHTHVEEAAQKSDDSTEVVTKDDREKRRKIRRGMNMFKKDKPKKV